MKRLKCPVCESMVAPTHPNKQKDMPRHIQRHMEQRTRENAAKSLAVIMKRRVKRGGKP